MLRCLIVDDSRRFLDAARGLLERQGLTVVGVVSNGADARRQSEQLRPDVILLDVDLGGESGFELARQLYGDGVRTALILISVRVEQDYADMIAESPAIGFLPKTALSAGAIQELLAAHRGRGTEVSGPADS